MPSSRRSKTCGKRATARRREASDSGDQNVQAAKPVTGVFYDLVRSVARVDVRLNETGGGAVGGDSPGGCEDRCASIGEAPEDGSADALGAAADEDAFPGGLG